MKEESVDVRVMRIVKQFDYLVGERETVLIDQVRHRAQFCPGIMEEPELQELVQIIKDCTIKSIRKDSLGFWYNF